MKNVIHYFLLTVVLILTPLQAAGLSMEKLRLEERQIALGDFKKIYKERHRFNEQLLQTIKHRRSKSVQHNSLSSYGGVNRGGGEGMKKGANLMNVQGSMNPYQESPGQGSIENPNSASKGQGSMNPWGRGPN